MTTSAKPATFLSTTQGLTTTRVNVPTTTLATTPATSQGVLLKYRQLKKSLYIWNPGNKNKDDVDWWAWTPRNIQLLVSVCKIHGFSHVMVFTGSVYWDWKSSWSQQKVPFEDMFITLFGELRRAGITVTATFYLNDEPNDMTNYQRAADVGATFVRFNSANPQSAVSGVDGDQEPEKVSAEYLEMNRLLAGGKLQVGASLKPAWLKPASKTPTPLQAVLGSLTSGMIMAYRSDAREVRSLADEMLAQAASIGASASVAVETSWRPPPEETLWALARSDPSSFIKMLVDLDEHLAKAGKAYQGLVLHDYEGYFKAMYGVLATDYPAAEVTELFSR